MITISHLTKVYRSKKKKQNKALSDVNLVLPHTGLVFVLGKSGSGKSTLLNLIGGLDTATSGAIDVDGNIVSRFREKRLADYRNSHVGFIFQDYHLIDELTVYENIRLSLSLLNTHSDRAIYDALEQVGLTGYEGRFPTELSGGERQRVAIARAIVKKPRIILADEPTGNLDNNTATQIVSILKELSKDCLIVTVSHNTTDAYIYADRIVELAKGKVIADFTRNPQFADTVSIDGDTLVYPQRTYLSDQDISVIDAGLSVGSVRRIIKRMDKFLPTQPLMPEDKKEKIRRAGLSAGDFTRLSARFLKNKAVAISLSSFMVAIIMVIMALAQTIISFEASEIIAGEMEKSSMGSLFFIKQVDEETQKRLGGDYRVLVEQEDIQAFYDAGYEGKIYPVLNVSVPVTEYKHAAGINTTYFSRGHYINESLGTMVVDEAFLQQKFGELKYHAKLEKFDPAGVIITDYLADSILATNTSYTDMEYADLLGPYNKIWWTQASITINGVIDTGYADRYEKVLTRIKNNDYKSVSQMYQDDAYVKLSNEIYEKLGFSYSLNQNFAEDYTNSAHSGAYVFYQKLMVNNQVPLGQDDAGDLFLCRGRASTANMAGWRYTQAAPHVPENAKYMRVSFGTSALAVMAEGFAQLPVADKMCAHIVFSNEETVDASVLNVTAGAFISPENGTITVNKDYQDAYVSDYIEIPAGCTLAEFCTLTLPGNAYCAFYDENKDFVSSYTTTDRERMPEATMVMNYHQYNETFGASYEINTLNLFVPHTIELTQYRLYDEACEEPLFTTEVTITGLTTDVGGVSEDVAQLFAQQQVYQDSLYFDGTKGIGTVSEQAKTLNYEHQSYVIEGIFTMTRAVEVFIPIFQLVAIIQSVGVVFILINFSTKLIREKMHEIGILKALGAKNATVGAIFGVQVVLIAVLTCVLATVGYYMFIGLANDVLMESLTRVAPSRVLLDLDFLYFKPAVAAANCALVVLLSAIALLVPILKVRKIEPVKIIRTRE